VINNIDNFQMEKIMIVM